MIKDSIDVLFSFDTTGSMYPCLTQVRSKLQETVRRLFDDIPYLRIGVLAHGDYCDGPRAITKFDFSSNIGEICRFIATVQATSGGDMPECYELALHEARSFSWSAGKNKAVVLIGDDVPHVPCHPENKKRLDWRNELKLLCEAGVHVHAVQALARGHATSFWQEVAHITGGVHLQLHQFHNVTELLMALCYRQGAPEKFEAFEHEVQKQGRMSRSMEQAFETMSLKPRAKKARSSVHGAASLEAVHPSRFQVLDVREDCDISDFVQDNGLRFRIGRGFYQFTKSVSVQDHKEVILVDKKTGDMYSGKDARRLLKLPENGTIKIKPGADNASALAAFSVFIQSTSPNRKLIGGTRFLYEVEDWAS